MIPGCSALPLFCGPPKLDFFGGVGTPASGNVVVGLTGQIMGVDLLTGGRYTQPGNIDVKIIDDCGLGNGAIGVAITEKYPNEDSQSSEQDEFFVSNVVILDPGSNYLTTPDGSTGGDGSLFSGKCDTVINTDVYVPGKTVKVKKGQTIYLPRRTVVEIVNNQGEIVQTLNGQGQLTPIAITENGTILTPDCAPDPPGVTPSGATAPTPTAPPPTTPTTAATTPSDIVGQTIPGGPVPGSPIGSIGPSDLNGDTILGEPTSSGGGNNATYQVYVCIEDLAILNGGVNYSPGDQIVINPNNGAKFEPIIDEFGVLREVRLVAKGCGFTDNPEIFVESQTGINALLVPVYSFTRLDSEVDPFVVSPGSPVVNVVDCVGKVK